MRGGRWADRRQRQLFLPSPGDIRPQLKYHREQRTVDDWPIYIFSKYDFRGDFVLLFFFERFKLISVTCNGTRLLRYFCTTRLGRDDDRDQGQVQLLQHSTSSSRTTVVDDLTLTGA